MRSATCREDSTCVCSKWRPIPDTMPPGMQIMDVHTQAPPPREARELPAMDAQFGVDTQGRLLSSLQEAANDFSKAMSANGYLRARAVRMRLLHQHICAITGPHPPGRLKAALPPATRLPMTCVTLLVESHRSGCAARMCLDCQLISAKHRAGIYCSVIFCL